MWCNCIHQHRAWMFKPEGSVLPSLIQLLLWYMHISQYYSCHPDCCWYPCDKNCIESNDTAYSDCLKRGANMCLSPQQDFTMNYIPTMYLSILYWPPTIQKLIDTSLLHDIHCSERLEYFCILKSCWQWSCASDGLRSNVTDRYLFLNCICLSIC